MARLHGYSAEVCPGPQFCGRHWAVQPLVQLRPAIGCAGLKPGDRDQQPLPEPTEAIGSKLGHLQGATVPEKRKGNTPFLHHMSGS